MFDRCFVVIPTFNEEERISQVVRSLLEVGLGNIIVVDDGSSDRTVERARVEGALVVVHCLNRGQGAALQTGTDMARNLGADTVVHFDGDGQFNPQDIKPAIERLVGGAYDIVLGSRFLDDRSASIPWFKRTIMFPCARIINRFFTGLMLTDVHNGFRVLGKRALNEVIIVHDRMAHNSDIVAQIKQKNLRFVEHPVEVRYFEYGQGMRGGFDIVRDWFLGWFIS